MLPSCLRTALAFEILLLCACGTTGSSVFDAGEPTDRDTTGDVRSDAPKLMFDTGSDAPTFDAAACASDHAAANPSPAFLVFIMDHSDSMAKDSKWTSCSAALNTFFSSKRTVDVSASLTWLPYVPMGAKYSCNATDYETPAIPMTPLPSPAFRTAIAKETLQCCTPTLAALTGTVTYAMSVQTAHPKDKVLIVLATDGKPAGCSGNTVTTVTSEAAIASKAGIPTYVIGVGTATSNLDAIAAGGGTKAALIVSTTDPKTTTREFEKAIEQIQGTLGCDYPIPSPPSGQMIDYGKVNVELTSSGKKSFLTYSADCSDKDGWHYDDPKNPSHIVLCSGACTEAHTVGAGSIDIVFGCTTNGIK